MLRKALILVALALVELVSSCSNGSSNNIPPAAIGPFLAWPRIRRTDGNLGLSTSSIDNNDGVARLLHTFVNEICLGEKCVAICLADDDCDRPDESCLDGQCGIACSPDDDCVGEGELCVDGSCVTSCLSDGECGNEGESCIDGSCVTSCFGDDDCIQVTPTGSSPVLGRSTSIYLGTEEGLLSVNADGVQRWMVTQCVLGGEVIAFDPIESSPTISPSGRDIVLTSNRIFRLREPESGDDPPECLLAFDSPSRSSALIIIDGFDLSFLSTIVGNVNGQLLSISDTARRRWSFPAGEPFDGDISSSPAFTTGGIAILTPNGELHSVDPTGRLRWSVRIGDAYEGDSAIPSPVSLDNLYAVSAAGNVVAVSASGTRLWEFTPAAPIIGSVTTSSLTTDNGTFLGDNVVFALDRGGTLYGLTASDGNMVRFCESINRACLPSTCPNGGACGLRCSEHVATTCTTDSDCTGMGVCETRAVCSGTDNVCANDDACESGQTCGLFCKDDTTLSCTQDTCIGNSTAGRCKRLGRHPFSTGGAVDVESDPILTGDSFVLASTTDGKICARRIDGSVPNGHCARICSSDDDCDGAPCLVADGHCDESGATCTPDSCVGDDRCCTSDDSSCSVTGACIDNPSQACISDTCDDGEICLTPWADGCVDLGEDVGETTTSPPVMDGIGNVFVATEKGLAKIE